MPTERERRRLSAAASRVCSILFSFGLVVACSGSRVGAKKVDPWASTAVSDKCPDLARADELAAFDFAREYALSDSAGEKLKAATLTAIEVGILADKLDADLGIACAQIAHDLGNKGDWRSGNDACTAAIKALEGARAKLGPKAQTRLIVRAPLCLADPAFVTKCASLCDSSVAAGKVRAECEQKAGRCDGNCDGFCEPKATSKCDGVCSGTCEGPMKGACGGRCRGTCDGRPVNGGCLGVCAGTCDRGAMSGECKGACAGSCKLAKPGICDGTCAGTCTVELEGEKCAGSFKEPEVSADCQARCDLATINGTVCSTPHVGFVAVGAKDREAADSMKAALDKSLPALLKVLSEVGEQGPQRVQAAHSVIENARKGFKELALSGGKDAAAASETQLVKCFDQPFKKAAASALAVKTGIDQAMRVRSEASR